jgi:hypothetical protein
MTDTNWTGMRNHRTIAVRVSDDHYRYLQEQKAAGTPIVEVIRQALATHIASAT